MYLYLCVYLCVCVCVCACGLGRGNAALPLRRCAEVVEAAAGGVGGCGAGGGVFGVWVVVGCWVRAVSYHRQYIFVKVFRLKEAAAAHIHAYTHNIPSLFWGFDAIFHVFK